MEIKKTTADDFIVARECENIATENLIENGGELQFSKTVYECDEIVYLIINDSIVGYVAIKYGYRLKDDAYIMQVAIKKNYQRNGYGTMLYNYVKNNIKGVNYLTCDIKEKNKKSINFHIKNKFYAKKYVNLTIYEYKM